MPDTDTESGSLWSRVKDLLPLVADAAIGGAIGGPAGAVAGLGGAGQAEFKQQELNQQKQNQALERAMRARRTAVEQQRADQQKSYQDQEVTARNQEVQLRRDEFNQRVGAAAKTDDAYKQWVSGQPKDDQERLLAIPPGTARNSIITEREKNRDAEKHRPQLMADLAKRGVDPSTLDGVPARDMARMLTRKPETGAKVPKPPKPTDILAEHVELGKGITTASDAWDKAHPTTGDPNLDPDSAKVAPAKAAWMTQRLALTNKAYNRMSPEERKSFQTALTGYLKGGGTDLQTFLDSHFPTTPPTAASAPKAETPKTEAAAKPSAPKTPPAGLPAGSTPNDDGTWTLPDGTKVRPKK
jgi:hypothetical protein